MFAKSLLPLVAGAGFALADVYVDPSSSCQSNCGTNAAPFVTIQDAVDYLPGFGFIILKNGMYTGAGNKNIRMTAYNGIKSESGNANNAIIDCENDGFGINFQSNNPEFNAFTIRNCVGTDMGGAIGIINTGLAKIYDMVLTNNEATNGGALYLRAGTFHIAGSNITNNKASDKGAGVYMENGTLKINNEATQTNTTIIKNNSNATMGGGMYIKGTNAEISQIEITGNSAEYGAGIYVISNNNGGFQLKDNSVIRDNTETKDDNDREGNVYSEKSQSNFDATSDIETSTVTCDAMSVIRKLETGEDLCQDNDSGSGNGGQKTSSTTSVLVGCMVFTLSLFL